MKQFLSLLDGKWLAQQTLYNIILDKNISQKCEVYYQPFSESNPLVTTLLKQVSSYDNLNIIDVSWRNSNRQLNQVICFFYNRQSKEGKFIAWDKEECIKPYKGNFRLNDAGILNLKILMGPITKHQKFYNPTDKLRFISTINKIYGICISVSFISKIKCNS
mmetsp:Transcript_23371/g.92919  ORF Transcript_23371/g.92919 Transcript_23371/m.92919 type:complete len:162 (+) Transcript_23371:982-1467(+)